MRVAVIADEITALGWRLAGADVLIPERAAEARSFQSALDSAEFVLITAEIASRIPADQLATALRTPKPLVLVIPDLRHLQEPPDIRSEARRALGIAS